MSAKHIEAYKTTQKAVLSGREIEAIIARPIAP